MDSIDGNAISISIKEENVDRSNDLWYGTTSELTNHSDTEIIRPLHLFSHNDARNLVRSNDILNNSSTLSISTGNYVNQGNIGQIKIKTEPNSDVISKNIEQESTVYNNQNNKLEEKISNAKAPIIPTEDTPTDMKTTDLFQDLSVSRYGEQNKGEKCKIQHSSGSTSNVVLEFWEVDKSEMSCNVVNGSSQLTVYKVNENETNPETKQKENVTSALDILKNFRTNLKQNPQKSTSAQLLIEDYTGNNERSQMRQRYLSSKGSDQIPLTPDTCTSEILKNTTGKLLSEKSLPSILTHRRKVNIVYKNISKPTQTKVPKCIFAPRKIKPITRLEQRILQDGLGKVQNDQVTDNVLLDYVNRSAINQVVSQQTSSDPSVPCPKRIVMYSESFDHDAPSLIQQNDVGSKGSKQITKVEQQILQNGLGKVQNYRVTDNALLDNVNRSAVNQVANQQTSSDPSVPYPERIVMYSGTIDHETPRIIQQNHIGPKGSKNTRIVYVKNSADKRYTEDKNKRKDSQHARSEFVKLPSRIPDHRKKNPVSILHKPVPNDLPKNAPANASKTTLPIQNVPTAPATDMVSLINNPPQYSTPDKDAAKQDANPSSLQFLPTVPCPERIEMYSESFDHDSPRLIQQNDIESKGPKTTRIVYVKNSADKRYIEDKNKRKDSQLADSEFIKLPHQIPDYRKKNLVSILHKPVPNVLPENAPANANKTTLPFHNVPTAPAPDMVSLINNPPQYSNPDKDAAKQDANPSSLQFLPTVPCHELIEMYSESFDHDSPRLIQQNDIGSKGPKATRIVYVKNSADKRYIEDKNKRKDSQLACFEFIKLPPQIPDYRKKNLVNILHKPVPNDLPENAQTNANKTTIPIQNVPTAPAPDMVSLMNNPPQYSNPDKDAAKQDANPSSLQFLPTALSHSSLQNSIVLLGQNQSYSMLPDNLFTTMQPITYIPLIVPLESVPLESALTPLPLGSMPFPVSSAHSNPVTFSSENLQQIAVEQMLNTSSDVIVVKGSPVNQTIHPNSINSSGNLSNTVGLQPNLSFSSLGNSVQQQHLSKTPSFQVSPGNMAHTFSFDANNHKHSLPNDNSSITSENRQLLNYQLAQGLTRRSENNSNQLPLEESLDAQIKCEAKHSPSDFTLNDTVTEFSTHSSTFKAGMNTPEESIDDISIDEIIGTPQHANYETLQKLKNNVIQEELLRPKINWNNLRRLKYLGNRRKRKWPSSYRLSGKKRKYTITKPLVLDRSKRCFSDRYKAPMPSNVFHNGIEVESPDLNIVVESVYSLSNDSDGTDKAKDDLLHCKWFLKRQRSYFINKFKRNMKLFGIRNCKEFIDPKLSTPCFVVLDSLRNYRNTTLGNCRKTTTIYTKKIKACTQQCRDKVVADFCYKISKGKIMRHYKQEKE
ncbi:unnamed protein product [Mytilus coruscus]|uniref:Uncharacterized protein n=1 Tax=Mytilus coruscus TaxID=42192 RepID=A0A6J8DDN6_MYTCO|nr:unnamed protein product [Mytilus coruscus]